MHEWWKFIPVGAVILLLGWGMYRLVDQRSEINAEIADLQSKFEALKKDNEETERDIRYYEDPENRLKEARAQFNFKAPGENLLILVPALTTATTSTSTASSTE
jgi:cell division protein FtsB